jgi:hypothetical protein
LLGGTELHRWAPALGDKPQQYCFRLSFALRRCAGGQHADACSDAALSIDDFERATSKNGGLALSEGWAPLLRKSKNEEPEIHYR